MMPQVVSVSYDPGGNMVVTLADGRIFVRAGITWVEMFPDFDGIEDKYRRKKA